MWTQAPRFQSLWRLSINAEQAQEETPYLSAGPHKASLTLPGLCPGRYFSKACLNIGYSEISLLDGDTQSLCSVESVDLSYRQHRDAMAPKGFTGVFDLAFWLVFMVFKGYSLCPAADQKCLEALLVPSSLCVISESMASRC